MTSEEDNSLIDPDDPLGLTASLSPEQLRWLEEQRQVQQRLAVLYSSSPLYQARAAKDPNYWNTFSVGGVR